MSQLSIEVRRSPAKVSWWVVVNGAFLSAFDRKWEAKAYAEGLSKRYQRTLQGSLGQ